MKGVMTNGGDTSVDILSQEITEMVLSETFLKKEVLQPRIRAILSAYIKKVDVPKNLHKPLKEGSVGKYVLTIRKKDLEISFWKGVIKKLVGENNMQHHYDSIQQYLKEHGF